LSLRYYAPRSIHGDQRLRPLADRLAQKCQRSARAGRHAQSASDATLGYQSDAVTVFSKDLHLAPTHTDPAALAHCRIELGDECAGDNLGRSRMTPESSKNATAAATATADSADIPGVCGLENQIGSVSPGQDVYHLGPIDGTTPAIPNTAVCPLGKHQATRSLRTKRGRCQPRNPFRDAPGSCDRPMSAHLTPPPQLTSDLSRAEATDDTAVYSIMSRAGEQVHFVIAGARTSGQRLGKPLSDLDRCIETGPTCSQVNGIEYRYTEYTRAADNWDRSIVIRSSKRLAWEASTITWRFSYSRSPHHTDIEWTTA
jgi:hypothetical protein